MPKKQAKAPISSDREKHPNRSERPISAAYPEIDNDLARDNLENDIPEPDLPD